MSHPEAPIRLLDVVNRTYTSSVGIVVVIRHQIGTVRRHDAYLPVNFKFSDTKTGRKAFYITGEPKFKSEASTKSRKLYSTINCSLLAFSNLCSVWSFSLSLIKKKESQLEQ